MWSKILLLFWTFSTEVIESSKVFDWGTDSAVTLRDYCPKASGCADGSHVMCMHYNPKQISGPNCHNFQNLTMTAELSNLILAMINEIRGKVAMGKETVSGGVPVPRGYGIFKVKWDNTLATFAQVKANTCLLKFDLCRATKNFKAPGQFLSIVRFTIPDWVPVQNRDIFNNSHGLTIDKIKYAERQVIESLYSQKEQVNVNDIQNYPDFDMAKNKFGDRYLQLINAKMTHIGCGISGYTDYLQNFKKKETSNRLTFNTIQVVCNLSSTPQKGKPIFDLVRKGPEEMCKKDDHLCLKSYNSKCGCPAYIGEDDRCLCTDPISYSHTPPPRPAPTCGKDENCKPAVVLLPIFTVEDAPPSMLSRRKQVSKRPLADREGGSKGAVVVSSSEIYHNEIDGQTPRRNFVYSPDAVMKPDAQSSQETYNTHHSYIMQSLEPPFTKQKLSNMPNDIYDDHGSYESHNNTNKRYDKTESLFSRSPKFELHDGGDNVHGAKPILRNMIKDVMPRKDFSNAKVALDRYLYEKRHQEVSNHNVHNTPFENHIGNAFEEVHNKAFVTIKPRFRNLKPETPKPETQDYPVKPETVDYSNKTISKTITTDMNKFHDSDFHVHEKMTQGEIEHVAENNINEDKDKKLMSLLNTLEQEVKNIKLKRDEKEIFDKKIKKIYSSVVQKEPETDSEYTDFKKSKNFDSRKYESDNDNDFNSKTDIPTKTMLKKQMHEVEDIFKKLNTKYSENLYSRPIARDQNALRPNIDKSMGLEFRNTYSDLENYESKFDKKYDESPKSNHKESYDIEQDNEVKSLPQTYNYNNIQNEDYVPSFHRRSKNIHNNLRSSEYNHVKENKYYGAEFDKRSRNFNRDFHNHKAHYGEEMVKDYDNKRRTFNIRKDYADYAEEPLSSERMKFYQDKLENLKRDNAHLPYNKPANNLLNPSERYERQRAPGVRVTETNGVRRYYLPNRALSRPRHSY